MSRFDPITNRLSAVSSLVQSEEEPDPEAFERGSTQLYSVDTDISRPEDEIEEYWRLYETNPLIAGPVNRTATEVFEPGYYITADSQDTEKELMEYAQNMGIKGGMPRRDFSEVGKQAVIQHQVRGTFLAEKVRDSKGRHNALNPVRSNTIEIHTRPDSNILIAPNEAEKYGDVKETTEGKAAAFVQFDTDDARWTDRKERRFARDEMLFWPRKPDVNDVRGTSRLESVYERARALEAKFRDNDDAIAMKAWPMILFQLGSEDRPWTQTQQEEFMKDYEEGNLGPGMYQGVPGDVDVHEFAGETADIQEHAETDVDFVLAGMPGPKYALGTFSENTSTTVASAQERQYRKLIRGLRRALEDLFTPYLVEVAESWSLDTDDIQLHIGRPEGEVPPDEVAGSVIRYTSDAGKEDRETAEKSNSGSQNDPGENEEEDQPEPTENTGGAANEEATTLLPDNVPDGIAVEELADPRLTNTDGALSALAVPVVDSMVRARDATIDEIRNSRNGSELAPVRLAERFRREMEQALVDGGLQRTAESEFQQVAEDVLATMAQESHSPQINRSYGAREQRLVDARVSEVERDIDAIADDAANIIRQKITTGVSEDADRVVRRIRNELDGDTIRARAELVASMQVRGLVNDIKLAAYEVDDRITGVAITNPCSSSTTALCSSLAGCKSGDRATAYFDADESLGEQFESQTSVDLFSGFDPLPQTPPFHMHCNSELVPVTDEPETA